MAENDSQKLAKKIGLSVLLGVVIGLVLYFTGNAEWSQYTKPIGTVFIRLLKMIIIPLVFSSVFIAIMNLGSPENLGKMGETGNYLLYRYYFNCSFYWPCFS